MSQLEKYPIDLENPARAPVRYNITVRPGTYEERLQRAGLKIGQWWADKFKVETAFRCETTVYVLRLPINFYTTDLPAVLAPLGLAAARIEHLLGFAECHPDEVAHMPLMVTATSDVVPFVDDWKLMVYPALKIERKMGAIGVEYKDYNHYNDKWIEDDVSLLCLREKK